MYTLKKSLGQHFLHDKAVIENIVSAVSREGLERLLEIGPGGGALTQHLVTWTEVDFKAIEVDAEKINYLLSTYPALQGKLIHEDILKAERPFESNFSVVGNLPYNISSPILFKLWDWGDEVDEIVCMLQKEVAVRIASVHGKKDYGILSVLLQAYFEVTYLFDVGEQCFTPPPKVKSGVLRLKNLHNPYEIKDKKAFTKMVKAAFSQRRKTLRNALKSYYPPELLTDDIFMKRAEQLSVAQFVTLYKEVLGHE